MAAKNKQVEYDGSASDLFKKAFEQNEQVETDTTGPDLSVAEESVPAADKPDFMEEFDNLPNSDTDNTDIEASPTSEDLKKSTDSLTASDASNDIETFHVKGVNGLRQEVNIDYADKKAIKQAFIKAAGMRKFQTERDQSNKKSKDISEKYETLSTDFKKLETAFSQDGVRGVVNLLGNSEDAFEDAVREHLERKDHLETLTSDEKYKLELEDRDRKHQVQLDSEKKQRENFELKIQEQQEQSELNKLESMITPAFDRYRFAGKLGDTETENLYDEAMFTQLQKRLAEYPDSVTLTKAHVDKEVRNIAQRFKKHINIQTEKKVKTVIDKKKTDTINRASHAAKKGLSGSTVQTDILKSLKSGNLGGALGLWRSNK